MGEERSIVGLPLLQLLLDELPLERLAGEGQALHRIVEAKCSGTLLLLQYYTELLLVLISSAELVGA